MRALVMVSWLALMASFLGYPWLMGMAYDYIEQGYGLMPELAALLGVVLGCFQYLYACYITRVEAEYC